jgi:hypothetical protein
MNLWMMAQFVKNMLKMPLSSDEGAVVHRHHFVLVTMLLLGAFLQCALQMAICARSRLLKQSPTQTRTLDT